MARFLSADDRTQLAVKIKGATSGIWWDLVGFDGNIRGLSGFGAEILSHHCLIERG